MKTIMALLMNLFVVVVAIAAPVIISGVPQYEQTIGCAPNAGLEIFGYYDGVGYGNLMAGTAPALTAGVGTEMAQLASWMHTVGGTTLVTDIAPGMSAFAADKGYDFGAVTYDFREFSWSTYTQAIDLGKPVLMSVDSNGDWSVDHAVASIGYDDRGADGLWYGFYTGWQEPETLQWARFAWSVFNGSAWGIGFATFVDPVISASSVLGGVVAAPVPVPEPATILLLGGGLVFMFYQFQAFRLIRKGGK